MKPALGRDLGTLLGNQSASAAPEADGASQPGPGVRSLLRGHRPEPVPSEASAPIQPVLPLLTGTEPPVEPAPSAPSASPSVIPPWYFFAADVLVSGLAVVLLFKGPGAISWGQRLFYMALVALGGCLAVGGVLLSDKAD